MGTKGALMCAQPRNPDQTNDTAANIPAAVELQQGNSANGPNRQPRQRGGASRAGRNLVVRGVRRDPPDMRKLARVVASLAADLAQAEASEQTLPTEPGTADASHPDHRRDAA
jgi:hypothetical protein